MLAAYPPGDCEVQTLKIDPEFQSLIPALSDDERAELEASLKAEGCRDALVVWAGQGVLLDGHNRYAICQAHGIPFQVVERTFESRDHVIVWIVKNQLARRNLSQYARDEMVTQHMKPALFRMGLERKKEGASNTKTKVSAESAETLPPPLPDQAQRHKRDQHEQRARGQRDQHQRRRRKRPPAR